MTPKPIAEPTSITHQSVSIRRSAWLSGWRTFCRPPAPLPQPASASTSGRSAAMVTSRKRRNVFSEVPSWISLRRARVSEP